MTTRHPIHKAGARTAGRRSAVLVAGLVAVATLAAPAAPAVGAGPVDAAAAATAAAPGWHSGVCTPADVNAVTIVVDPQDLGGTTLVRCAHHLRTGATGRDALAAAAIPVVGTGHDGASFVCRLAGKPTATQQIPIVGNPTYTEDCVDTPPAAAYWSYWSARPSGPWKYATRGYLTSRVIFGGFEGWSFSLNKTASTNPPPRASTTPSRITAHGTVSGTKSRKGDPALGRVSYRVDVQAWRNASGDITYVRGIGRVTKVSTTTAVQVDRVTLETSTKVVQQATGAVNSGTYSLAAGVTPWTPLAPGTCVSYRSRATFSVYWTSTAVFPFSATSALTTVCRAAGR